MRFCIRKVGPALAGFSLCFGSAMQNRAIAANYTGRLTTGAYTSTETHSEETNGTKSNDFATFSNRAYLNIFDIGDRRYQWVTDLRDKHDFFDKLNKELKTLDSQNRLQLRQMSFKDSSEGRRFYWTLGRFPVLESGATYTDGADAGLRLSPSLSAGIFGGLNPKRDDQSYLSFQRDSRVAGGYFLYDPHKQSWGSSAYMANALTAKEYRGQLDRLFWFHNSILQFQRSDRLISLVYVDFRPTWRLQNLNISYRHEFSRQFASFARVSAIDVIEYLRKQNLRERLRPSPYQELEVEGQFNATPISSYSVSALHGVRRLDSKTFSEGKFGGSWSRFIARYFAANAALGYRKNFDSRDVFAKAGFSFYSKWWELGWTEEWALERYNDGSSLAPLTSELSAAHFFTRALYGTLSLQYAKDQRVSIFSFFFKLSYRFGSSNVAPLRDGAPPPGGA